MATKTHDVGTLIYCAAESLGFHRIPAWTGWQKHYNRREFWHYQFDEGLT